MHGGLRLPQHPLIKAVFHRYGHGPVWVRQFFIWCSLGDSRLCSCAPSSQWPFERVGWSPRYSSQPHLSTLAEGSVAHTLLHCWCLPHLRGLCSDLNSQLFSSITLEYCRLTLHCHHPTLPALAVFPGLSPVALTLCNMLPARFSDFARLLCPLPRLLGTGICFILQCTLKVDCMNECII